MKIFASAFSDKWSWQESVADCLNQIKDKTQGATLGFVYVADHFVPHLQAILETLKEQSPTHKWVGTTGIGICAPGKESYEQPALSLMVTDINPDHFRVFNSLDDNLVEFSKQHSTWYTQNEAHLGILHGDPGNAALPTLIEQLADILPNSYLVGGLTSSRGDNLQITECGLTKDSISGVLFSEEVPVVTALTQGCSPIGPKHQITSYQRNVIISLDDQPALEVMKQDMGEILSRDMQNMGSYIFAGFPVKGSDTGDYLVRNLMGVDEQNNLVAVGEMLDEHDNMMFCRRDGNTAREDMQRMLQKIKSRIGKQQPKGALYFTCLGRGRSLFGPDSNELRMIQEELGDIPLTGFYCNGEIAHNQLYGYTGVLTVFL
jgi:small ligand-binding sensory domain FIST